MTDVEDYLEETSGSPECGVPGYEEDDQTLKTMSGGSQEEEGVVEICRWCETGLVEKEESQFTYICKFCNRQYDHEDLPRKHESIVLGMERQEEVNWRPRYNPDAPSISPGGD